MKKSQILAALALAFALGVVAPASGVFAQITPNTANQTQKDEMYKDVADVLADANRLEDYDSYKTLYNTFEGNDGLVEKLSDIKGKNSANKDESLYKIWNRGLSNPQSTNVYINDVARIIANPDLKDLIISGKESKAVLKPIAAFTGNFTSMKQAYDTVESVIKAAQDNISILNNNYTYVDGNLADQAAKQYAAIISDLNGYVADLNNALNADVNGVNIATYVNAISSIDADAATKMTRSSNWIANPVTNIGKANDLGQIITTARALPKYKLAGAVATAEANVEKIKADSGTDVDYKEAQGFVAILTAAIKNYREGKVDGTGDGNNTDDNKGDQNAPDTGILANAEGSASTTVAMVAGIATALTAAGAGVVAYRNARRSSRK